MHAGGVGRHYHYLSIAKEKLMSIRHCINNRRCCSNGKRNFLYISIFTKGDISSLSYSSYAVYRHLHDPAIAVSRRKRQNFFLHVIMIITVMTSTNEQICAWVITPISIMAIALPRERMVRIVSTTRHLFPEVCHCPLVWQHQPLASSPSHPPSISGWSSLTVV